MDLTAEALINSLDGTAYVVDGAGIILAYGAKNWRQFALENGCPQLTIEDNVLGRNLFDSVAGEEVVTKYKSLLENLMSGQSPSIVLPYRCDGPSFKRDMRLAMTLVSTDDGMKGVLFHSVTLSEEMRPPMDIFDFSALQATLPEQEDIAILAMCSFCQRVRCSVGSKELRGRWADVDTYYRLGGTSSVRISHTICPACFQET